MNLLPGFSPLGVAIIACLASLVVGLAGGYKVADWKCKAEQNEAIAEAADKYVKATERSEQLAGKLAAKVAEYEGKRQIVVKEIHRETTKTEYRCPLPESGRMLYMRAAKGDSTVAREIQGAVPSTGPATGTEKPVE